MKSIKKICCFLGSRANYSSLKPLMKEIQKDPALELCLFVGASALLDKYGQVVDLVKKDGFQVAEYIYMLVEGENPTTMAKSTGLGLIELANLLYKRRPDWALIVGDRHEMLSMALAASFANVRIAHTMGGESSGTIDESIRHVITKLAHLHFPATEKAKSNIIKMGEDPRHVFNFGCPRMDFIKEILAKDYTEPINQILGQEGVGDALALHHNFLLVSQHPVTTEFGQGQKQIKQTLEALAEIQQMKGLAVIMLWPNADAGSDEISRGMRIFREKNRPKAFRFIKNLPFEIYIHLMKKTKCLIGNSSAGVREGSFLGTPVVNIGSRQQDRERSANVVDVDYNQAEIKQAILKQLEHGPYPSSKLYGRGQAAPQIIETIKKSKPTIQKKLHY